MGRIQDTRKKIEQIHNQLMSNGIHQFTIDLVEDMDSELLDQEAGESRVDDDTLLGALAYRIDCILEIASNTNEDYLIFKKIKEIIEEVRKA